MPASHSKGPAACGTQPRVREAMGVVPLAHLSPSGVEVWSLSAAGQGWSEAPPTAGSWFPGARGPSELAVTLQGQKGQQDRVVRRGLDGHGWVAAAPTAAQLQGGGLRGSARKVALPLSGLCLHCSCH